MLKKFKLKNYKNFRNEISIEFDKVAKYEFNKTCIIDGKYIGKMIIYGRNATGKTNFGKAILDIMTIFRDRLDNFTNGLLVNADSEEEEVDFSYTFEFNKEEVVYAYSRISELELSRESLMIAKKQVFDFDYINQKFNYADLSKWMKIEKFFEVLKLESGKRGTVLPFLRWLYLNTLFKYSEVIDYLSSYIMRMNMMTLRGGVSLLVKRRNYDFFKSLQEDEQLKEFEAFLNRMGVACKLSVKTLPDESVELYFVHGRLLPFYENASSGTLALTNLYRNLFYEMDHPSFVYLDEFDAFYHYEMAENFIEYMKDKYPKCQIIFTSHNTNLINNELMRPDCLFILSKNGCLTSFNNATKREIREGHNLEKMYISGEFEDYE